MTLRKLMVPAAVLAATVFGGFASAATVTATFNHVNTGADVNVKFNGSDTSTRAGKFTWTELSDTTNALPSATNTQFTTFCIEFNQHINYNNTYTYDIVDVASAPKPGLLVNNGNGMGSAKADALRELWGRHFASIGTNSTMAAAFQIAVWEIVYDWGSTGLSSGIFRLNTTGDIATQAVSFLSTLNGSGPKAYLIGMSSGGANGAQDQLTLGTPPPPTPSPAVPLPTAAVSGLGLMALSTLARRK